MTATGDLRGIEDLENLTGLLRDFGEAIGLPCGFLDPSGRPVVAVDRQAVCCRFQCDAAGPGSPCQDSDRELLAQATAVAHGDDGWVWHECPHGMIRAAFPLLLDGDMVGTVATGHFFLEAPDEDRYRQRAAELEHDPDAYMGAIRQVPVRPREELERWLTLQTRVFRRFLSGQQREARYSELVSELTLGWVRVRPVWRDGRVADLVYLEANEAYRHILALGAEDVRGRSALPLFNPRTLDKWLGVAEQVLTGGGPVHFVEYAGTVDRWVDVKAYRAADGQLAALVSDASDLLEARRELTESVERLEMAADMADMAIWEWREETGHLEASERWCQQVGLSATEARGINLVTWYEDHVHPEDRPALTAAWHELHAKAPSHGAAQYRLVLDNQVRWFHTMAHRLRDEVGGVRGRIIGVQWDMTRFREAELAMQESEDRFRDITENTIFATHILQDGVLVYVNDAWCRLLGCERSQALGRSYAELLQTGSAQAVECPLADDSGGGSAKEMYLTTRSGHSFWASVYGRPINYRHQPASLGIWQDITVQKHAELAVRESEDRYRALFEHSNDAILLLDAKLTCADCNQQAMVLFGARKRRQLLGRTPWELSPPQQPDGQSSESRIRAQVAGNAEDAPSPEWLCRRLDGVLFEGSIGLSKLSVRGQPMVQVVVRDVSQQVQAARAARDRERRLRMAANLARTGSFLWLVDDNAWVPDSEIAQLFGMGGGGAGTRHPIPSFFEAVVPADIGRFRAASAQHLTGEQESFSCEFRRSLPDGKIRWFGCVGQITERDKEGHPLVVLVVCQDITERKVADRDLQRAKFALAQASQEVWLVNLKGAVVHVNPAVCRETGYVPEELIGRQLSDIHPDSDARMFRIYIERLRQGRGIQIQSVHRRRDGSRYPVRINIDLFNDGDEELALGMAQNITSELAALESLKQTQFMVDHSADEVYFLDSEGRFAYANRTALHRYGFTSETLSTHTIFDVNPVIDATWWHDAWEQNTEGDPLLFDTRHLRADGTEYPVEVNLVHLTTGGRELKCAFARDISERKEYERRLEHIWQVARLAFWEYDPESGIYSGGPHLSEIMEASPAAFTAEHVRSILHPDDTATYIAALDDSVRTRNHALRLTGRVLVHGKTKYLQTFVYQDFDAEGKLVRRYGIHLDVTDRERLNEALRQVPGLSRLTGSDFYERLTNLVPGLTGAVFCSVARLVTETGTRMRDLSSCQEGRNAVPNEWDLSKAEHACLVAGQPYIDDDAGARHGGVATHGWASYLSVPLLDSEGRALALLSAGFSTPVAEPELVLRILGVFASPAGAVIERERREQDLVAAREAAEAASQAKSAFLSTMSHEVRTPLNVIMGYGELLALEPLGDQEASYTQAIRLAAESLRDLLNDVLDLSRLEAGKLAIKLAAARIQDLLDEMHVIFVQQAKAKGLKLRTRVLGSPPTLVLDIERLRQVLMNLLGNAVKFTDLGCIDLTAEVQAEEAGTYRLRLLVTDTGIGIAEEQQEHVFTYFGQARAGDARRFPGSGLGLALCHRLVQLMGGSLLLSSEPERGSVFTVDIPGLASTDLPPDRSWEQRSESLPAFPGMTVLLVDDVRANLAVAASALRRMHATPVSANSGAEALELAGAALPDLVLLDLRMPDLAGDEVAARLRQLPGGAALPILAFTASAEPEKEFRTEDFDEILPKPLSLANLVRVLSQYLEPRLPNGADEELDSPPLPAPAARRASQRFAARLAELREALDPTELEDLLTELREFATSHGQPSLGAFADRLATAAGDYDLPAVDRLVERFAQLTAAAEDSAPPENAPRPE
ncbi:MAG: PAS domain S-box protein [Victivallales bacterium]|nr:PAS domain S-box protein [Victivallales bacterium]